MLIDCHDVGKLSPDVGAGREVANGDAARSGSRSHRHDVSVAVLELVRTDLAAPDVDFDP
jgi:hypothetical protein